MSDFSDDMEEEYASQDDEEYDYPDDDDSDDDSDQEECGNGLSIPPESIPLARQQSYEVLSTNDIVAIRKRLVDEVKEWGLSDHQAVLVLNDTDWESPATRGIEIDLDRLQRQASGGTCASGSNNCIVCDRPWTEVEKFSLPCGHIFCRECWKEYIQTNVYSRGAKIIALPCMGCKEVIPSEVFSRFCHETGMVKENKIYESYLVNGFVTRHRKFTQCPGRGCAKIMRYTKETERDVQCDCGEYFCFVCKEMAHQPITCSKIKMWVSKAVDEGETDKYLRSHTKACPSCKTPIEVHVCTAQCSDPCDLKSRPALGGCNHFTCNCGYQFCWMCMRDWSTHGSKTGGFYQCNVYTASVVDTDVQGIMDSERERLKAAESMRRYEFFFKRYTQHKQGVAAVPALAADVTKCKMILLKGISDHSKNKGLNIADPFYLEFLDEAVEIVVKCRRLLMQSYVFCYYLPTNSPKINILQVQQGIMEEMTDHLHEKLGSLDARHCRQLVEDLKSGHDDNLIFNWKFKQELCTYDSALKDYLRNIFDEIQRFETELHADAAVNASANAAAEYDESGIMWMCHACTFVNCHVSHQLRCETCNTPRKSLLAS